MLSRYQFQPGCDRPFHSQAAPVANSLLRMLSRYQFQPGCDRPFHSQPVNLAKILNFKPNLRASVTIFNKPRTAPNVKSPA
ncbi:hypothetical protein [Oscillatoria nigro-viridis]|uniref:hypothetical protein n=1 Tax=Phormidium nigroviride TaxID=482564 RepID=UPI0002FBEFDA|nr:hypothetical protein [Oscillatoria nigro-viridis]